MRYLDLITKENNQPFEKLSNTIERVQSLIDTLEVHQEKEGIDFIIELLTLYKINLS